ncbi:transmembrane and immunoglobulin domain-containing protein 1-like [Ptychodera flava]|uniref:transmembrane and immunoglobulin domain-containing protein 1-like n=1 Tax=Ptychodera flava TaxID=63121 RepID=UPI003969F396
MASVTDEELLRKQELVMYLNDSYSRVMIRCKLQPTSWNEHPQIKRYWKRCKAAALFRCFTVLFCVAPSHRGPNRPFHDNGAVYNCQYENRDIPSDLWPQLTCADDIIVDVQYPATVAVTNKTIGPVLEGDKVFAVCQITENGNPEVIHDLYWLGPDGRRANDWLLLIDNATRGDNGTYICMAENLYYDDSTGRGIMSYDVIVHYKPSIKGEDKETIDVTKGSSVSLFCSAEANPNAKITWKREGEALDAVADNGTYIINSVVQDNEGTYTCTAENYLGDDQREIKLYVMSSSGYTTVVPAVSTLTFIVVLHCE